MIPHKIGVVEDISKVGKMKYNFSLEEGMFSYCKNIQNILHYII
jgi:hypothetical protein